MIIMMRLWLLLIALLSLVACGGKGLSSESLSNSSGIIGSSASGSASSVNASDAHESSTGAASSFDPRTLIVTRDYCNGGEHIRDVYTNSSYSQPLTFSSSSVSFSATSSQYYSHDCSEQPAFAYTPPEQISKARLDAGEYNAALTDDGEMVFWGETRALEAPADMPPVARVEMGGQFLVLLHTDRTASILRPSAGLTMEREIIDVDEVVEISASSNHALFLLQSGSVATWGSNDKGQADVPAGLADVMAVSTGDGFSLALLKNGELVHWGDPFNKPPAHLKDLIAVDSNGKNNIALDKQGRIHTWGNFYQSAQKLPDGLTDEYGAVHVIAGNQSYLAKLADGSLVSWYADEFNDLPHWDSHIEFKEIAPGHGHTLARDQYGQLYAWGAESHHANLTLPGDLVNIDRMADGYSDALLLRDIHVFNLNGYQHFVENLPSSDIKMFQFNHSSFSLLYENGDVYIAPLVEGTASDFPLLQKPDQPVRELVMGSYSNLYLLNDGSLIQFAFDGVVPPPVDIPGPIKNLVGDQTSVTLENGNFYNWNNQEVSLDISIDVKNIISYDADLLAHAALTSSGDLMHWKSTSDYVVDDNGSQIRVEELDDPTLIATGIKKFKFLQDGNIFYLTKGGEVGFWSQQDIGELPQYMQPPSGLEAVKNISASNDQFYALTEGGQLVVWGREIFYPPNFHKLLTNE